MPGLGIEPCASSGNAACGASVNAPRGATSPVCGVTLLTPCIPCPSPVIVTSAPDTAIRPISHQSTNDKVLSLAKRALAPNARVLDLGAGEGYFSSVLGEYGKRALGVEPKALVSACDVTPEIFRYSAIVCDRIDSDGTLPYANATFDLVCSLEVAEHVENQFAFCREMLRVVKPGGLVVISTPNVLNLNSRWRMLATGFATLFNPLSLTTVDVVHTSGHIHPVNAYYLSYALRRAGASEVQVDYDRLKRSAFGWLLVSWPILLLGNLWFRLKLRRKQPEVLTENRPLLRDMQSFKMLTSRSIIMVARRERTA